MAGRSISTSRRTVVDRTRDKRGSGGEQPKQPGKAAPQRQPADAGWPDGWMTADEIVDELMLQLDDDELWGLPPPGTIRH